MYAMLITGPLLVPKTWITETVQSVPISLSWGECHGLQNCPDIYSRG